MGVHRGDGAAEKETGGAGVETILLGETDAEPAAEPDLLGVTDDDAKAKPDLLGETDADAATELVLLVEPVLLGVSNANVEAEKLGEAERVADADALLCASASADKSARARKKPALARWRIFSAPLFRPRFRLRRRKRPD